MKNCVLKNIVFSVFLLGLLSLHAQTKKVNSKPKNSSTSPKNHPVTSKITKTDKVNRNQFKLNAEESLIFDTVQYRTFQYFWDGAEPNSGLAPERIHTDNNYPENDQHVITTGGSGFGIMAITAGYYRGWISLNDYLSRLEKMLGFLDKADRFHGAWPHWIDGNTGQVKPFSKYDDGGDLVESSFLMQGLLCVKGFLSEHQKWMPQQKENNLVLERRKERIVQKINQFWNEMEFDWYTNGKNVLYWHWSPKNGWKMNFGVRGYNECFIMYVLAAASPTHPILPEVYHFGWADSGRIVNKHPKKFGNFSLNFRYQGNPPNGGPLFWAHYSYLALNPMGLSDKYCADYGLENTNLTKMNHLWCVKNPLKYKGYGDSSWGLTAGYSVGFYAAHAPDSLNDKGVISPTAAISSYPYSPVESTKAMVNWYKNKRKLLGQYGFYDGFSDQENWMLPHYLAIDQGPVAVMMENYRSGLFWDIFMGDKDVKRGLHILGMKVNQQK